MFADVLKRGMWYHSPHLTLRVLAVSLQIKSRFAVSVSKKVAKRAVARNLLKRRLLSIIQEVLKETRPDSNGIFFYKSGGAELTFSALKEEALSLLKKSRILP
ncbi:MAG: ribonuclease P protein component [Candidatus Pacebacteria bacterium]|nr:ribonuclease P protein component [Candidatus Paceibacterota bacterium]MDD5356828.1 ribonuclease P protein component [Candidatus Paceibacterota bacterium]